MRCLPTIRERRTTHMELMAISLKRVRFVPSGINRNDFLSVIQMRPDQPADSGILEWVAFASNAFNVLVPFYATIDTTPDYLSSTTKEVTTDNFYWVSRIIGAMGRCFLQKLCISH